MVVVRTAVVFAVVLGARVRDLRVARAAVCMAAPLAVPSPCPMPSPGYMALALLLSLVPPADLRPPAALPALPPSPGVTACGGLPLPPTRKATSKASRFVLRLSCVMVVDRWPVFCRV